MKKVVLITLILVVVVGIFGVVLLNPPSMPPKSLAFTIKSTRSSNNSPTTISVLLSNASQYPVLFKAGSDQPWFRIAYLSNGVWTQSSLRTPDGGERILRTGESAASMIEVPESAGAVRVGLSITSLTWRGRVAWWLLVNQSQTVFGLVESFLASIEERRRSTNEWSNIFVIAPSN